MTDGQWLLAVFVTLYVLECLRWAPAGVLVVCGVGRHWRQRRPGGFIEVARLRPFLLAVLPPPRLHLLTAEWLFVPVGEGLEVGVPGNRQVVPWGELKPEAEEATLHLTPNLRLRLANKEAARWWAEKLIKWREMTPLQRIDEFLKEALFSLRLPNTRRQCRRLTLITRLLRWQGGFIFVWTFGVMVVVYRWFGESIETLAAAAILFAAMWLQAGAFWLAAGRSRRPVRHRFWKALIMALLPQHAMRAPDLLCAQGGRLPHPLATRGLIEEKDWLRLAIAQWKEARFAGGKGSELRLRALGEFFQRVSLATQELEEVPERAAGSEGYCPCCLSQFRTADAACQDCGGLAVRCWPHEGTLTAGAGSCAGHRRS